MQSEGQEGGHESPSDKKKHRLIPFLCGRDKEEGDRARGCRGGGGEEGGGEEGEYDGGKLGQEVTNLLVIKSDE